jgi:GNAT superfamily N-acetyltransferase
LIQARSVLLVHPPLICPAAPPLLPAITAARLRAAGASALLYDANHDFFLNHLLKPDSLKDCLASVHTRRDRGDYVRLGDALLLEQLADMETNPSDWEQRCGRITDAVAIMQEERFYGPAQYVAARGLIDWALDLASLAYFPYRLHWNGLHHPEAGTWDAALAICQDERNPFHALEQRLLSLAQDHDVLAFCLEQPDQLLPALNLRAAVMEQRPGLTMCFWGPGLNGVPQAEGFQLLPGEDPAVLCAALGLSDPGPQPPEFDGLEGYLSPEAAGGAVKTYAAGSAPSLDALKEDYASGVSAVRWLAERETETQMLAAILRSAAKAGLWSQVDLAANAGPDLATWCAANPNLAHSVVQARPHASGFSGPPPAPPASEPKVGTLEPMPGRPVWRWLEQEAHLALYVRRHGVRQTRTYRVRDDGSVYSLGQGVEYHFVHYPDLGEWHLQSILDLITSAGKVKPDWLRHNIERSFLVAYALEEGVMIATETLKHPRPEYIQKVRERTGLDFTKYLERGYIVVRPEYRGLGVGDYLVKGCLARAEGYKTFLTISAENETAKKMTYRHGTRFFLRYYSEEMGKEIELWTPGDQENLPEEREAK